MRVKDQYGFGGIEAKGISGENVGMLRGLLIGGSYMVRVKWVEENDVRIKSNAKRDQCSLLDQNGLGTSLSKVTRPRAQSKKQLALD